MEAMDREPDSPFDASVAKIVTVFVWGSLLSMRVPSFKFWSSILIIWWSSLSLGILIVDSSVDKVGVLDIELIMFSIEDSRFCRKSSFFIVSCIRDLCSWRILSSCFSKHVNCQLLLGGGIFCEESMLCAVSDCIVGGVLTEGL